MENNEQILMSQSSTCESLVLVQPTRQSSKIQFTIIKLSKLRKQTNIHILEAGTCNFALKMM